MVDDLGMVIHGCAYREGSSGMWVALPSRRYEEDGKAKYIGHVGFPERDVYNDFQTTAKEAIERHLASSGPVGDEDIPF